MPVKFEFASTLYRNRSEMLAGIASEWWTAGGINSDEQIRAMIAEGADPKAQARECIKGWGLGEAELVSPLMDDEAESHMKFNGYTADDLAEAMAEYTRSIMAAE